MRTADLQPWLTGEHEWTWVYTDGPMGEPPGAVESRMRSLKGRLEETGVPAEDVDAVMAALDSGDGLPAPSSRWILARDGQVEADESFAAARKAEETCGYGRYPEIEPLLRHLAADVRVLLVETGRDGGDITLVRLRQAEPELTRSVEGDDEHLTKVNAGGLSQANYQRHAEETWQHNQSDVAEVVDRVVREHRPEHVFITGDVRARQLLLEEISEAARDLAVEVDADTRAVGSDELALEEAIAETVHARRRADLSEVRDRAAAGDASAGAVGAADVVAALQQARVDTLVLDARVPEGDSALLALDTEPWIAVSAEDAYGVAGTRMRENEALVRAAVLTDARVMFIESELEEGEERPDRSAAQPLAALRWEQDERASEPAAADLGSSDAASSGHSDAASRHPSQAEGEDPDDEDSHVDPRQDGHPSPAEG